MKNSNNMLYCDHEFEDPVYEPEIQSAIQEVQIVKDGKTYVKKVNLGKDIVYDRWSRVCSKCGMKQYTYVSNEVPVKIIKVPKF